MRENVSSRKSLGVYDMKISEGNSCAKQMDAIDDALPKIKANYNSTAFIELFYDFKKAVPEQSKYLKSSDCNLL